MATKKTKGFVDIWETLSAVSVNEYTEKKGNLTYLSWAFAHRVLMSHFPDATVKFTTWGEADLPVRFFPDGSGEVECTVSVPYGGEVYERSMWLPIMDNRNKAVKNPDSRQVSDCKMRCYVKCLGMGFGLGHYIYEGEDVPPGPCEPQSNPGEGMKGVEEWGEKNGVAIGVVEDFYHLKKGGVELREVDEKGVLSFLAYLNSANGRRKVIEFHNDIESQEEPENE